MRVPSTRARYLPQCVSGGPPPASPRACSHSGSRPSVTPSGVSPTASSPTSPSRGRRPVATSTSSATTSPAPVVRVTGPPWSRPTPVPRASGRSHPVTSVERRTSTPFARRESATASPACGSIRSSRLPPRTSIVTREPRAASHVAASQATTPPPTIAIRSGTSRRPVASRDPHGRASRKGPGTTGSLPVAMTTACRARRRVGPPVTSTSRSPTRRPCPRTGVIPAPSTQSC